MIKEWLTTNNAIFPPPGSPDECGRLREYCYPVGADRRAYFQDIVKRARVGFGYELLVLLAQAAVFDLVWTTNFDGLSARAAAGTPVTAIEVGLDSADRVRRQKRADELQHGASRCMVIIGMMRSRIYFSPELQSQDSVLRAAFIEHAKESTVVVLGYSGRDDSIMEMFETAVATPGSGRFVWCGFQKDTPPTRVEKLLEGARRAGRQAFYVSSNGFDDTMRRLALQCLDGSLADRARAVLSRSDSANDANRVPFSLPPGETAALIKTNCFAVDCPAEVYQFFGPEFEAQRGMGWTSGDLGQYTHSRRNPRSKYCRDWYFKRDQGRIWIADPRWGGNRVSIAERELNMSNGVIVSMVILQQKLVRSLAGVRSWRPMRIECCAGARAI